MHRTHADASDSSDPGWLLRIGHKVALLSLAIAIIVMAVNVFMQLVEAPSQSWAPASISQFTTNLRFAPLSSAVV